MGGSAFPVTIKVRAGISVDPPSVELSASNGDYIVWNADPDNLDFLVCFGNKSPFNGSHFTNRNNNSGPPQVVPGKGHDVEFFKYSVEVGSLKVDPGVIILR
jgi:hypothetical protein